jgi:hypothetical protein
MLAHTARHSWFKPWCRNHKPIGLTVVALASFHRRSLLLLDLGLRRPALGLFDWIA